jgi:hypothetical protein
VPRPYSEGTEVVVHYLGTTETGTVERVEDDGRVIVVVTDSASVLEFRSARLSVR